MWIRCLLRMKKQMMRSRLSAWKTGWKGFRNHSHCTGGLFELFYSQIVNIKRTKRTVCAKKIWRAVYHYFQTYPKWASWRLCGTSGARWCRGGHTGSSPWRSSSRPRDCRGCRGTHTWGWELVTNVTTSCHMSLVRTREAHNCESRLWYYTWA